MTEAPIPEGWMFDGSTFTRIDGVNATVVGINDDGSMSAMHDNHLNSHSSTVDIPADIVRAWLKLLSRPR